jgi:hypothetical protein
MKLFDEIKMFLNYLVYLYDGDCSGYLWDIETNRALPKARPA